MHSEFSSVIAAATRWLLSAYPATGGALSRALAEAQARQAAMVAAALRHPTAVDAALLGLLAPGGADRLDRIAGAWIAEEDGADGWRTWVDEVVVSWAACLLSDPGLAASAVTALAATEHGPSLAGDALRLTGPGIHDRAAAALLRHPDLVAPIADLHRAELTALLAAEPLDSFPA
ncbi:hypothetical protein [Actinacidiphila glaucinigra]|uniref:hypothetical protein n=1 Tax=Actinacidiphila glaucinigra TaxID=235986 RepID=UPI002E35BA51|nr:hypothetical protein [Actinacidiphila glaucinigra]